MTIVYSLVANAKKNVLAEYTAVRACCVLSSLSLLPSSCSYLRHSTAAPRCCCRPRGISPL